MPLDPDCRSIVINGKSGYKRENSSWIIGRIVRDFHYWSNTETKEKTASIIAAHWEESKKRDANIPKPDAAGLVVSIYRPSDEVPAMKPASDMIYWSGIITAIIQLGIAAIPVGLFGDWGVLLITGAGICLALLTGALGQWRKEKWNCRPNPNGTFILTKGNGAQHVIVVLGSFNRGLNLEDLASGQGTLNVAPNMFTRISLFCLALLWILLQITAAGLKNNTWFLLAVGGIGMVQNIFAAGSPRRPESFGIPLDFEMVIGEKQVMQTLYAVEAVYPRVGRSMLEEFFPGKLRVNEISRWAEFEEQADSIDAAGKHAEKLAGRERAVVTCAR